MKKILTVFVLMMTFFTVVSAAPYSTRRVVSGGWEMVDDVNAVFSTRRVISGGWEMVDDVNAVFSTRRVISGGW